MPREHGPEMMSRARERYCVDRQSAPEIASGLGTAVSTVRRWADQNDWDRERQAIAEAEAEIRANTVKARAFALRKLLDAQSGNEASRAAAAVAALERAVLERLWAQRLAENGSGADAACAASDGKGPKREKTGKTGPDCGSGTAGIARRKKSVSMAATAPAGPPAPGSPYPGPAPGEAGIDTASAPMAFFGAGEAWPAPDGEGPRPLSGEDRIRLLEEAVNRQLAFVLASPVDDFSKRIKEIKAALDVLATIKGRDARDTGVVVSFAEGEE